MVEDVFAVRMILGVERHDADGASRAVARNQMRALPALVWRSAAAFFERLQEIPGDERIERRVRRIGERVPGCAIDVLQIAKNLDSDGVAGIHSTLSNWSRARRQNR